MGRTVTVCKKEVMVKEYSEEVIVWSSTGLGQMDQLGSR